MHAEEAGRRERAIPWIQALRAFAALTVAAVHLTDGFARHVDDRLAWLPTGEQLAQSAVALFFVISGCVMVISSGPMAGRPGASLQFWRRRAVRVIPPYWIATLLLAVVLMALALPVAAADVARSMVFAISPAPAGHPAAFVLLLWPGWTLVYELGFYALFGLCLTLGRSRSLAICAALLVALVLAGIWIHPQSLHPLVITRPVILLFVVGMGAAMILPGLARIPPLAAVGLVVLAAAGIVWIPEPETWLGWHWLVWAGVPAVAVFAAAGSVRLGGFAARSAAVLGGASYAVYLLHVPFAHVWMEVFNVRMGHPGGAVGFLVLGMPLLIVLSIGFYRWVERPMTTRLNMLLGGDPNGPRSHAKTHAP